MRNQNSINQHGRLVGKLAIMACGMFAFGFLLVPLYDVFCEITGIGGRIDNTAAVVTEESPRTDRVIKVEFVASLNQYAPWEFRPSVASMDVHPGQLYDTSFYARNLTGSALVGQAVPSIAPRQASRYFKKTECFCFSSQEFAEAESRDLPLQFMVDPDIPEHIDRLTLSYTFFLVKQVASNSNDI